ncbi:MAG TPA: hypothetical protein VK747_20440, partial [Blastocatellia bacterium]|nr:hypothetical protein [Blastocatellia bacterium]
RILSTNNMRNSASSIPSYASDDQSDSKQNCSISHRGNHKAIVLPKLAVGEEANDIGRWS